MTTILPSLGVPVHVHFSVPLHAVKWLTRLAVACSLCATALAETASSPCGPLENPYGPYDYQTQKHKLSVVEQYHFTPQVEGLVGGRTSHDVGSDLDYTLKAFPNHYRALMAVVRLSEKQRSPHPTGMPYPVDCYFERALRFRPADSTARMIYATYLFKTNQIIAGDHQLSLAAAGAGDNAFTHYNIGLIYLERQRYALALASAHKAYGLGFVQPGLRDQLQLRGKWKEPPPPRPEATPKTE